MGERRKNKTETLKANKDRDICCRLLVTDERKPRTADLLRDRFAENDNK